MGLFDKLRSNNACNSSNSLKQGSSESSEVDMQPTMNQNTYLLQKVCDFLDGHNYECAIYILKDLNENDPGVQYYLGKCYENSWGVLQDENKAEEYYKKSAEQGYEPAIEKIIEIAQKPAYRIMIKDITKWLRIPAEKGNKKAAYLLGDMYTFKAFIEDEYIEKSEYWFRKAIEYGCVKAYYGLFQLFHECYDVKTYNTNLEKAINYLFDGYKAGSIDCKTEIGIQYFLGDLLNKDLEKSYQLLKSASIQGSPKAQGFLGYLYSTGQGVKQSNKEAMKWYQLAAEHGEVEAMTRLASFYLNEDSAEYSEKDGIYWLEKGISNNDGRSYFRLGMHYYDKGCMAEAYTYLEKACELGYNRACRYFYSISRSQCKIETDPDKLFKYANELVKNPPEDDRAVSYFILGDCYESGIGTEIDRKKAKQCYQKSYDLGFTEALEIIRSMD